MVSSNFQLRNNLASALLNGLGSDGGSQMLHFSIFAVYVNKKQLSLLRSKVVVWFKIMNIFRSNVVTFK